MSAQAFALLVARHTACMLNNMKVPRERLRHCWDSPAQGAGSCMAQVARNPANGLKQLNS